MDGRIFSEETHTILLSRHGAGLVSRNKLAPEQELVLRCPQLDREAEIRVVGQIGSEGESYTYGVAFLDGSITFWEEDFPPLTAFERAAIRTFLQCTRCGLREVVDHSDLESDVYAVNEGILRFCKSCASSTLWKHAEDQSEIEPPPPPREPKKKEPIIATSAAPATTPTLSHEQVVTQFVPVTISSGPKTTGQPAANRRRFPRTRVRYAACIRRDGFPDDVVACEDMSRGGIRFKSKKRYFETTQIEVAVPYTEGGNSIFVPAKIVYVQELPEEQSFRCGVSYASRSQ